LEDVDKLKTQIVELRRAHSWAESLLAQYSDLYDFSCVSYFTLDRAGIIREVNKSGAKLLAVDRDSLPGHSFSEYIHEGSRLRFVRYLATVFGSPSNKLMESAVCNGEGEPLYVAIEGKVANNGKECRLAVTDITSLKRTEEDLRFMSMFDPLTGLHNRGFFQEEMARLEGGRDFPVSVMMADVDNLKDINDRLGHAAGDAVLRRIGRCLKAAFRAEDIVARIGGDEFAILLPSSGAAEAEEAARRVVRVIVDDNARHKEIPVSLSVGFSTAYVRSPLSAILRQADRRMYEAKHLVKGSERKAI
jgi:diguanylate cyclase (GGDEF)-like protein/PAS domain S-box-containing protein